MQLIFLLLALFAISCVLYGISAGVQSIQRGLSWLAHGVNGDASRATNAPTSTAPSAAAAQERCQQPLIAQPSDTSIQRSIAELRDIFALHQQGALTRAEFERMKQCLLVSIKPVTPEIH